MKSKNHENRTIYPTMFPKPQDLQEAIDEYFDTISPDVVPTIENLCNFLGITNTTLFNYAKKDGFKEIVEMAKQKIADGYIQGALNNQFNATFTMFIMKNMHGYKDKIEQENSGEQTITIRRSEIK